MVLQAQDDSPCPNTDYLSYQREEAVERDICMKVLLSLFLFAITASFSTASDKPKAKLMTFARPVKSPEASRQNLAGSGVFVMQMDVTTGRVVSISIQKSTGHPLLDRSVIEALRKWRCAPGTVRKIRTPITFTESDNAGRF